MARVRRFGKRPIDDLCNHDGCEKLKAGLQFCGTHAQRFRRYGDSSIVKPHYRSDRKCLVIEDGKECVKKHCAKDMCQKHYRRFSLYGDPLVKLVTGDKSPARYRVINKKGEPGTRPDGSIMEHRWVMQQKIGRALLPEETVHHINGDRMDNRIENLELWSHSHPYGQRIPDKVEWAIELLKTYAPDKLRNEDA